MEEDTSKVIAIDLGGTNVRAALVDRKGHFLARANQLTQPKMGETTVLSNINNVVQTVLTGFDPNEVLAIGIGVPGFVNPQTGFIHRMLGFPYWTGVNLQQKLEELFPWPIFLNNDANLAALGEYYYGAGKDSAGLLYITISSGIGGGFIERGHIFEGVNGVAFEVGHITVDINGPLCPCGNVGCLAMYACGPAIRFYAIKDLEQGQKSVLRDLCSGDLQKISPELVTQAATSGDAYCIDLLQRTGKHIGAGIVTLIHVCNPDCIIIGGGVTKIGSLLMEPIFAWVKAHTIPAFYEKIRFELAQLEDDSGLLGARVLAFDSYNKIK